MKSIKEIIKTFVGFQKIWNQLNLKIDSQKILSAKILINNNNKLESIKDFSEVEFSVFSQVGDDGIIQWIINKLPIPKSSKTFIEFGVENYIESTTRFLLINNNWRGFVMDGDDKNINYIKRDNISWMFNLKSKKVFITAENINSEFIEAGFTGEIGLLHIDIDGNDYWVWKAITVVSPILLILEYNSAFGPEREITIPYDPEFVANKAHFSRIYFGASLNALKRLSFEKGYTYLACNSSGNNAYFIRNDYAKYISHRIESNEFVQAEFKQNRDINNALTFKADTEVLNGLNLNVINIITNKIELI